jgi:hypothetical protein
VVAALVVAGVTWLMFRKKPAQDAPKTSNLPELTPPAPAPSPAANLPEFVPAPAPATETAAPAQAAPAPTPAPDAASAFPKPNPPIIFDFAYSPPSQPVPRKGE